MKLEMEGREPYMILLGVPLLMALAATGAVGIMRLSQQDALNGRAEAEIEVKVNPVTEGVDLPIKVTTTSDVINLPVAAQYTPKPIHIPVEVESKVSPTIKVPVQVKVERVQAAETKKAKNRTQPKTNRPEFDSTLPPPRGLKKE